MKARINEILESFREFVISHDYKEAPILTAYVNIDPTNPDNRRERPAWLIELKNEAKRLEGELDQAKLRRRATQEKWANTEDMVMQHLQDRQRTDRSVVLFTDHSDFIGIDLPVPVPTRLYYGLPQVKHLLFNLDQYKKYMVVLLSGADVRILEVFLTRTTDDMLVETEHNLADQISRKTDVQKHDRRAKEFEQRFMREVSSDINGHFLGDPDFERLVFGGNLKQAHAVTNMLHPSAREMLVAIEPIDFKSSDSQVAQQVKEIADGYEREHDLAVVDGLVASYNRSGTALLEKQGIERALEQGNVRSLVIPYPIDSDQFDAMIVNATVSGAEIEFVFDEAADKLNGFGGIGATLYYSGRLAPVGHGAQS